MKRTLSFIAMSIVTIGILFTGCTPPAPSQPQNAATKIIITPLEGTDFGEVAYGSSITKKFRLTTDGYLEDVPTLSDSAMFKASLTEKELIAFKNQKLTSKDFSITFTPQHKDENNGSVSVYIFGISNVTNNDVDLKGSCNDANLKAENDPTATGSLSLLDGYEGTVTMNKEETKDKYGYTVYNLNFTGSGKAKIRFAADAYAIERRNGSNTGPFNSNYSIKLPNSNNLEDNYVDFEFSYDDTKRPAELQTCTETITMPVIGEIKIKLKLSGTAAL